LTILTNCNFSKHR